MYLLRHRLFVSLFVSFVIEIMDSFSPSLLSPPYLFLCCFVRSSPLKWKNCSILCCCSFWWCFVENQINYKNSFKFLGGIFIISHNLVFGWIHLLCECCSRDVVHIKTRWKSLPHCTIYKLKSPFECFSNWNSSSGNVKPLMSVYTVCVVCSIFDKRIFAMWVTFGND